MEEASVVLPTDIYDFAPLNDLKKRIEEELSEMDAKFQLVLQQKIEEAERLRKENEEVERLAKAEAERKQREEEERIAAEKKANEEAEAVRQKREEEEKRKLAEDEAERKRKEEDRKKTEAAAEAERQRQAEEEKQRQITALIRTYNLNLNELNTLEFVNVDPSIIEKLKTLNSIGAELTETNLNDKNRLLREIIDFLTNHKPKTVAEIKATPEYKIILHDIIFIMESFYNKETATRQEIENDIKSDSKNNPIFTLIKKLYDEFKASNLYFIKNINNDDFSIINYAEIMEYIKNTINNEENRKTIQNNMSDLYEIIVGTARVAVRCKPKEDDNTSPAVTDNKTDYTFRDYFNSLSSTSVTPEPISSSGSGGSNSESSIFQAGGYNYNDIFNISPKNNLQITNGCNGKEKTYGPFYSIYPPQYNNYHIYYNMFGLNKFTDTTENSTNITKYNELLKDKLVILKDSRTFDTTNIDNKSHELMKKLKNGGSAVIFGYGFSGSGKTYALIEGLDNDMHYDPSILEQFIKDNSSEIKSVEFLELYPLGVSHNPHKALLPIIDTNATNIKKITTDNVTPDTIQKYAAEYGSNLNITTYTGQSIDIYAKIEGSISYEIISTRIKLLERHRIAKLRILSTPNNDKSSRSFLQITIKLKEVNINGIVKTPKLVLFDMPGTENTVRIKTQFINENILTDVQKIKKPINPKTSGQAIYDPNKMGSNINYINSLYPNNTEQFYSHTLTQKIANKDDNYGLCAQRAFKNFIMQRVCFEAIHVFIVNDSIISDDSLEFALFINSLDIERESYLDRKKGEVSEVFEKMYNKIQNNKIIYFLSEPLFMTIVKDFIKFLLQKDVKDTTIPKYFSVTSNKYCKIDNTLSSEDFKNIENIFNVKINLTTGTKIGALDHTNSPFIHFINDKFDDKTDIPNNLSFTKDLFVFDDNFVTKIETELDQGQDKKKKFNLQNKKTKSLGKQFNEINLPELSNTNTMYFANPLIKYIYLILNYLYRKTTHIKVIDIFDKLVKNPEINNALPQLFYRSATFFIYKYINFIVNQGRSIVTNLEHLKFFFLSRTGEIKTYNTKNPKKSFNWNTPDKNIIAQPNIYYNEPTIIGQINIDERINLGNMQIYGLIDILQELSSAPLLANCEIEINGTSSTINLLKSKSTTTTTTTTTTTISKLGAIFIMFANYKMFLDKTDIDSKSITEAKADLSTLCTAAKDTAEFTESISSTSINKIKDTPIIPTKVVHNSFVEHYKKTYGNALTPILQLLEQVAQGGKRKFNINQLLNNNNQHNQKHKTHKIKRFSSMKNILKNNKLFSTKTKKNKV